MRLEGAQNARAGAGRLHLQGGGNQPARISLWSLPAKEEIRQKNLFSVSEVRMFWHPQGEYLCVKGRCPPPCAHSAESHFQPTHLWALPGVACTRRRCGIEPLLRRCAPPLRHIKRSQHSKACAAASTAHALLSSLGRPR